MNGTRELSLSNSLSRELTQKAKLLFNNMPSPLLYRLNLFAKGLGIPISDVILNLLIDQWARTAARAKVNGGAAIRQLPEFAQETLEDGTKRLVTGVVLFKYLVKFYEGEIKQNPPKHELAQQMEFSIFRAEYLIKIARAPRPSQYWTLWDMPSPRRLIGEKSRKCPG